MVLEDVTEFENTPEGRRVTKLEEILLNGNNIVMVSWEKAMASIGSIGNDSNNYFPGFSFHD